MRGKWWRSQICHKASAHISTPTYSSTPQSSQTFQTTNCLPEPVPPEDSVNLCQVVDEFLCGYFSPFPTTLLWPLWELAKAVECPSSPPGRLWNPYFPFSSSGPDTGLYNPVSCRVELSSSGEEFQQRAMPSARNSRCALKNALPTAVLSFQVQRHFPRSTWSPSGSSRACYSLHELLPLSGP